MDHQARPAASGGALAALSSFPSCFSTNTSAASLFENVAIVGPLSSPSFTAKNAPSWTMTYVAIPLNVAQRRGRGDVPLKDPAKFRCAQCGSRLTDHVTMSKGSWCSPLGLPAHSFFG